MIVIKDEPSIAAYIERRLGVKISEPRIVLGFMTDAKKPLAGVVLNDYSGANIEMTVVAEPGGMTRGLCRYIANYVFNQLNCRRLTVRTKKRNKRVLKIAERGGFTFEGIAKRFFPDDDAVVYRMFKDECRWLKKPAHGG